MRAELIDHARSATRGALIALLLSVPHGCSTDVSPTGAADAASTSKPSTGGAPNQTDAARSTGGGAAACGADAGSDDCRQCLTANCCSDYVNCVKDPVCSAALDAYRLCVENATNTSVKGACIGGFSRTLKDAGASAPLGSAIGGCVYRACTVCGAAAI